jgi:hypothetical protein
LPRGLAPGEIAFASRNAPVGALRPSFGMFRHTVRAFGSAIAAPSRTSTRLMPFRRRFDRKTSAI